MENVNVICFQFIFHCLYAVGDSGVSFIQIYATHFDFRKLDGTLIYDRFVEIKSRRKTIPTHRQHKCVYRDKCHLTKGRKEVRSCLTFLSLVSHKYNLFIKVYVVSV